MKKIFYVLSELWKKHIFILKIDKNLRLAADFIEGKLICFTVLLLSCSYIPILHYQ